MRTPKGLPVVQEGDKAQTKELAFLLALGRALCIPRSLWRNVPKFSSAKHADTLTLQWQVCTLEGAHKGELIGFLRVFWHMSGRSGGTQMTCVRLQEAVGALPNRTYKPVQALAGNFPFQEEDFRAALCALADKGADAFEKAVVLVAPSAPAGDLEYATYRVSLSIIRIE